MNGQEKVPLASAEWISYAGKVLRELVSQHGCEGERFSLCEIFSDVPPTIAPTGTASWYLAIDGKAVETGPGELIGADVIIRADYMSTLPIARLIYTPEHLAQRAIQRASGPLPGVEGDLTKSPSYLAEVHNRLAVITA